MDLGFGGQSYEVSRSDRGVWILDLRQIANLKACRRTWGRVDPLKVG